MRNGHFLTPPEIEQKYVVENMVGANRLVLWASIPGEGKSLLSEALLYHVAYGAPYLGMDVKVGNVLVIDSENRRDVLRGRCTRIKAGLEMDGFKKQGEVDFKHYSGFLLDVKETWKPIAEEIKELKPSLIVLDHLTMFHLQDEDNSKGMTKVCNLIEELMSIGNSSALVMHHLNKMHSGPFVKRLRGSIAIYAKSDCACEVRSLAHNNGKLEKAGLIFQPRKDAMPDPIRVRIEEGDDWLKVKHDGTYVPVEDYKMDSIYHDIYHALLKAGVEMSVNDVIETLEGYASSREVRDSLRELENRALLGKRMLNRGKYMYKVVLKTCPWCFSEKAVKNEKN